MYPKYPRINPDRDRLRSYYLCEDVLVTLSDGNQCLIPEGYRFDGQSVPLIFKGLFPSFDTDVYAALVHDYLLDTEMLHRYKRSFIDAEYKRFMNMPCYYSTKVRRVFFPLIVSIAGYLKRSIWGL